MYHQFDVEVAKEVGVAPAIILNHLYWWIEKNRANERHFYDGRYWTYNSRKAFATQFSYLNEAQVRYALNRLEEGGYIETGNYNKSSYDRTLWYTITERGYSILENKHIHLTKLSNGCEKNSRPIPVIKPVINTVKSIPPLPPTGGEDIKRRPDMEPKPRDKFSGELLDAVNSWLDYKWERNRSAYYKETGYKNLIAQLCNCAKDYGEAALAQVIRRSMANNYQGICFAELKRNAKTPEKLYPHESKAYRAAKYLADQKLEDCPDRSQPTETDLQKWAKAMDELHEDNRVSWKVMAEVMDYSLDNEWWGPKTQSAYDFKTNFNKIFADMAKEQGAVKE